MRNKWESLSRLFPMGWPWQNEIILTAAALGLSTLTAMGLFMSRFTPALDDLYQRAYGQEPVLIPGRLVPPYPQVLGNALLGFGLVALCLILLPIGHFLWHRWGARSDYLMRRLPRRQELAKRCITGSALLLVITALTGLVMFGLLFLWYQAATPAGHLPPDVWARTGG
ncbi:hypothetical protein [Flavonifractor sp. HCP28S3_F3]|uniref:hypothetical protein n=1 Tax=Flavonifractor sp. HCP28S3_F3 TaxID=3438939 RepID=UPI003F88F9DA